MSPDADHALADLDALSLPALAERAAGASLDALLALARTEDLAERGDVTSAAIVPPDDRCRLVVRPRAAGVAAGLAFAPHVLEAFDCDATLEVAGADGATMAPGDRLLVLEGRSRDLLAVERTLLNLLGRLCGVATLTRAHVDAIAGTGAVVCETRKTTPGLRALEKYACRCGGAALHREGLHDAALFKDNHLARLPEGPLETTLPPALEAARAAGPLRFVEVEVDDLAQLESLLRIDAALVDLVLLDNMPPAILRRAVAMRDAARPGWGLEASGGVSLATIRPIAETGVDRISVGALTHSARCLDLGLDAD